MLQYLLQKHVDILREVLVLRSQNMIRSTWSNINCGKRIRIVSAQWDHQDEYFVKDRLKINGCKQLVLLPWCKYCMLFNWPIFSTKWFPKKKKKITSAHNKNFWRPHKILHVYLKTEYKIHISFVQSYNVATYETKWRVSSTAISVLQHQKFY